MNPQDNFKIKAKVRLAEREMTIRALAKKIKYAPNTVSMAINHPIFPRVRLKIKKELGLPV